MFERNIHSKLFVHRCALNSAPMGGLSKCIIEYVLFIFPNVEEFPSHTLLWENHHWLHTSQSVSAALMELLMAATARPYFAYKSHLHRVIRDNWTLGSDISLLIKFARWEGEPIWNWTDLENFWDTSLFHYIREAEMKNIMVWMLIGGENSIRK